MPELPEVEVMTQNLRRWTENQHITLGILDSTILVEPLTGIAGVAFRRGKYSVLPIGSNALILHYRMTGKLVCGRQRPHARLELRCSNGTSVWFLDVRRLGCVWAVPSVELDAFWEQKKIGPEIYPEQRSGAWWKNRFLGIKAPIKNALLRQSPVAGLGNICASEMCFRAFIHPETPTNSLSIEAWSRLSQASHLYLTSIISEESGTEISYVTQGGALPESFWVYGRAKEPCRRCSTPIVRIKQAGRSTFFCKKCTVVG